MQVVARQLALYDPDEPDWTVAWAFATRRADSLDAARRILVNAVERLPGVAVFLFNLACYEAQLGDVASAKAHLSRAIELCGDLRLRARYVRWRVVAAAEMQRANVRGKDE